ncbi:MAG TPA: prepilin-type N-terminal cleavage/methylation domain-containing protein [Polyangia bacterium]|jgi:type II secretion system protein H|nr:prepilin-type N-terminal cleavage/methylation domain-containing protein [Polyangia bacterium]
MLRPGRERRPERRQAGFSLVEVIIVLAVVGMMAGAVSVSFQSLHRARARGAAQRLAAAMRYSYDRSVTTGAYFRLVIDLTGQKYWAERSDERFYLVRGKEDSAGRGLAPGEEQEKEEERKRKEAEERAKFLSSGNALLDPTPARKKARFETFKDSALPKVELKDVRIRDIFTPRQREAYTEGKTYLYFFPDGHAERAWIHVADEEGDVYTLVLHPLTGRVEIKTGDLPVERDFELDAEGHSETPR